MIALISRAFRSGSALLAITLLAACGGATAPAGVATVQISGALSSMEIGQATQLQATPRDGKGNALTGLVVEWTTSNSSVASVTPGGLVTGVAVGSATITALSGGKTASSAIVVTAAAVANLQITPASPTVYLGGSRLITATPYDARGVELTGRAITWTSTSTAIATIVAGQLSGVALGTTTITATAEGKSAQANVTVAPVPVITVSVLPANASINMGQQQTFTATPRDSAGNALTGRSVVWSTSDASVASISGAGVVSTVGLGTATITATVEGRTGTAQLTVVSTPVATVVVSPGTPSLLIGQTTNFSATTFDAFGGVLTGRVVTFTSSSPGIVSVSASGSAEALSTGFATITATSEGKTGTTVAMAVRPYTAVSAGVTHSCALTSEGTAYCWGDNSDGQLGDGTALSRGSPVEVSTTLSFRAISAALNFTCALTVDNLAYCWGADASGQLGNGSPAARQFVPTPVAGGIDFLSLGTSHGPTICGVRILGGAGFCWGANDGNAQISGAPATNQLSPVAVSGGLSWRAMNMGQVHGCGVLAGSPIRTACWGGGVVAPTFANGAFAIASAGGSHSCGVTVLGGAFCWGSNGSGQIGDGSLIARPNPEAVVGTQVFSNITAGGSHTCAVAAGVGFCWGLGTAGQLGTSTFANSSLPVQVSAPAGVTFSTISAGLNHNCGLSTAGLLLCWGANGSGQLGNGAPSSSATPGVVRP